MLSSSQGTKLDHGQISQLENGQRQTNIGPGGGVMDFSELGSMLFNQLNPFGANQKKEENSMNTGNVGNSQNPQGSIRHETLQSSLIHINEAHEMDELEQQKMQNMLENTGKR